MGGDGELARRPDDPRADRLLERFARVFGADAGAVPVESIAEDLLGLRLVEDDLSAVGPGISGLLVVATRGLWTAASEPRVRRRFTIAHEIGHWVCHRADVPAGCTPQDAGASRDPREREANTFAASLLMPAGRVRAAHAHEPDAARLATRFVVSAEAMAWRLYNLGLGPRPAEGGSRS